ncbi:hypothetical protein C0993_003598 [Termitomyces sp. T159_Od127]|nr:hypothetical protein C0993_003598 [Termitomyces sp. T159_Od127]
MPLVVSTPALVPSPRSQTTKSYDNKREPAVPIPQFSDETDSTSQIPSTPRAVKQRNELLSSFDTLTSHLNTTFTALSSAFARLHDISKRQNDSESTKINRARAYMGIFVGSSPATAKAKVIFAVDGLEIKAIGARDDVTREQGSEEEEGGEVDEEEDNEEMNDGSDDNEEDSDEEEETDENDEEEDDEDDNDDRESSSPPPESRSPSPEPCYPSHAEQQRALQAAERLFSRTLAAADAKGNGMSTDLAPTQTHIMLRAPRRFVHPAWIPRQNLSATLESDLNEFLEESGIHNEDVQNIKPRKSSKRGKTVEGVWVVARGGLDTATGKDMVRGSDEEWDEMIWWNWDGKIVGFSDW